MREIADLLNQMRDAGVILQYALFGAFAQMRYTAPVATEDVDVLVRVPGPNVLADIDAFCERKGYAAEREAVRVGTWPLQFIPAFDDLTNDAIDSAESVPIEGTSLRVVRAAHLAVIALSVGRSKDFLRILALLESGGTNRDDIAWLAAEHDLSHVWQAFVSRFLDGL